MVGKLQTKHSHWLVATISNKVFRQHLSLAAMDYLNALCHQRAAISGLSPNLTYPKFVADGSGPALVERESKTPSTAHFMRISPSTSAAMNLSNTNIFFSQEGASTVIQPNCGCVFQITLGQWFLSWSNRMRMVNMNVA
jgi:hypothetical protein